MTRIVFISDVHVGSNYAVMPDDFKNPEDGSPVTLNRWQKELLRNWVKLSSELSPVDIIILMGDLVEGPQTKEKFGTLKIMNVQHQADAFIQLFTNTWRAKKVYVIRGTPYHVETLGVQTEEYIGKAIGAEKLDDKFSAHDLMLKINGKTIHAAHHLGVSHVPHYRFTPLAREMWLAKLFDDYFGKVDVVARGHVHYHIIARIEDVITAFTCPAWQLPTPYMRKRTALGSNPSVGLVEVVIEKGDIDVVSHLVKGFKPRTIEVDVNENREQG